MENIKVAVLLFPGAVISKRCFKHQHKASKTNNKFQVLKCPPRIGEREIGAIVKVHPTRNLTKETIVFVKNKDLPEMCR